MRLHHLQGSNLVQSNAALDPDRPYLPHIPYLYTFYGA
jgi:hypothetical protein